ncbi:hypothetical protein KQX54_007343 [Cotesia glomerata]|uniref:Secreted protein n=1 Tax=Cotesia glomerata TaxID=32391 RepID=A0AAV7IA64_COTGL|nr:hypothetical protein KQX54_007343 [Cotesia glomerata]
MLILFLCSLRFVVRVNRVGPHQPFPFGFSHRSASRLIVGLPLAKASMPNRGKDDLERGLRQAEYSIFGLTTLKRLTDNCGVRPSRVSPWKPHRTNRRVLLHFGGTQLTSVQLQPVRFRPGVPIPTKRPTNYPSQASASASTHLHIHPVVTLMKLVA